MHVEPNLLQRPVARNFDSQSHRTVHMLIVSDDPSKVELCLQELKRAQIGVRAEVVRTPESFAEHLRSHKFDVVLADDSVHGCTGTQTLELLQQLAPDIPFILMAHMLEEKVLNEFFKKGIFDWVDKNHLARLPLAVTLSVEEKALYQERDQAERALRRSEAHYRALVENPTYGICQFDTTGHFLDVNYALVTMLGYATADELMAVNLATDIIHDPRERAQLLDLFRETPPGDCIEVEWRRKDGSPMKVRLNGRRVLAVEGIEDSCRIIVEDVTEQRASEDRLRHLAATDPLTGLANYRKLAESLEVEIKRSDRTGRAFAVLVFDLNGLREINNRFGHLVGNRAICRLADIFRMTCRSIDTAARYGGDEFAVVLPETTATAATQVLKRICETLGNDGEEPCLSVSAGMASYPQDGKTMERLLHVADRALYTMKSEPRAHIVKRVGR
jgi:diguanylate cyclase (GGDEF)-like protein/PAS domain S-box-containing protein